MRRLLPSSLSALLALAALGAAGWRLSQGHRLGDVPLFWLLAVGIGLAALSLYSRQEDTSWASQAPLALFALLATVVANAVATMAPVHLDWTANRVLTITAETRSLLAGLEQPLQVKVFAAPLSTERVDAERLMERLERVGSNLSWEFVNPQMSPLVTSEYGASRGDVVLELGGRRQMMETPDEDGFANALLRLTLGERTVCFTQGHGEPPLAGEDALFALTALLERKALVPRTLELFDLETAQEAGCNAILVVGPTGPFLEGELAVLAALWEEVGVVFMVDPAVQSESPLREWLATQGLLVGADPLVDVRSSHPLQVISPASLLARHQATKGIRQNLIFSLAAPVSAEAPWQATGLAHTGDWAWVESDLEGDTWQPDPGEAEGELVVALAAEAGNRRVGLVGDSDFVHDADVAVFSSHQALVLGLARWAMGPGESVELPVRERGVDPLTITEGTARRLGLIYTAAIIALVGQGIATQVARRRR